MKKENPSKHIFFLLGFGLFAEDFITEIKNRYLDPEMKDFNYSVFFPADKREHAAALEMEVGTPSLGGGKKIIVKKGLSDIPESVLKNCLANCPQETILIITHHETKISQKIKTLTDKTPGCECRTFYHPDLKAARQYIGGYLEKRRLTADAEAHTMLAAYMVSHGEIIKGELEKICLADHETIGADYVRSILPEGTSPDFFSFTGHILTKNCQAALAAAAEFFKIEKSPAGVCVFLRTRLEKMLMYNSLRQNGLSAGEAMTQCGVPNHFRARDEFKNSIEKFKPVHIMRFLSRLYDFDVAMRNNDESITQQLFIKLIISTCA